MAQAELTNSTSRRKNRSVSASIEYDPLTLECMLLWRSLSPVEKLAAIERMKDTFGKNDELALAFEQAFLASLNT